MFRLYFIEMSTNLLLLGLVWLMFLTTDCEKTMPVTVVDTFYVENTL